MLNSSFKFFAPFPGISELIENTQMNSSEDFILTLTEEDLEDWGLQIEARTMKAPIWKDEVIELY